MGEVTDIAIVGVINDILKYDVSLMFTNVNQVFYVTLTWIGPYPDGSTAMGTARGANAKLYLALSAAYKDMVAPFKKDSEE